MDNLFIANEWFEVADMDISSAKFLQNMHPSPIEIIKIHDLVMLNKLCHKYDDEFEVLEEECLRLTDYGVNIRYPYPMILNSADMELAIKDAEKIKNFILRKVELIKSETD